MEWLEGTMKSINSSPSRRTPKIRYLRNIILAVLGSILFLMLTLVPAWLTYQDTHPTRYPVGDISPADLGFDFIDVVVETKDGITLRGWYVPSKNGAAVIMLHAYNGNRTGVIYHAALLAEKGYGVLLCDMRAHGESGGDISARGQEAYPDVEAMLDYLETRSDISQGRLGILGLSRGATIALYGTALDQRIKAVVAEGVGCPTFTDWFSMSSWKGKLYTPILWEYFLFTGLATDVLRPEPLLQAIKRISPRALLLISAGSENIYAREYISVAGEPKEHWEREEPGHIDALFTHPQEYTERVLPFFEQSLLSP
jgi:pimeloyl-ACP methyl ester carboxylesterase